ncbi:hypothetical protein [Bradyrhizobium sp. CER78]|uniref:hypothetical protein n=1 Tax=Bradyrhizobium sp. CER78 TaxID=3039162 RepID=UPI00244CC6AC|nr:hypothetical protein [Bradyrhizobium sp. CER78]MDH2384316.1 hypothetical protein [Bradyrhizobium sp. CER78]
MKRLLSSLLVSLSAAWLPASAKEPQIRRATHFVEVETGRDVLFREVQSFLDRN